MRVIGPKYNVGCCHSDELCYPRLSLQEKKLEIYFKSRFGESAVTRLSNRLQKIDSSRLPHIYG